MKRVILLSILCLTVVGSTARAQSKMPSGQFGLGFFVAPGTGGISGTFAINHNLQVGAALALGVGSANGGPTSTNFLFDPFFRFVFPGNVNPFVEGALQVQSSSVGGGASTTNVGLGFGGGIAYGISQNFNVDFDLGLIGIGFSNGGSFSFGFTNVAVEGKWFF